MDALRNPYQQGRYYNKSTQLFEEHVPLGMQRIISEPVARYGESRELKLPRSGWCY